MAPNFISRLSDEILLLIFERFMDQSGMLDPSSLRAFRLVDQNWHDLVTPLIYRKMALTYGHFYTLEASPTGVRTVMGRLFSEPAQATLLNILEYARSLTVPNLDDMWMEFIPWILLHCKKLREIGFNFSPVEYFAFAGPKKTGLAPTVGSNFPPRLYEALEQCPDVLVRFYNYTIGTHEGSLLPLPISKMLVFEGDIRNGLPGTRVLTEKLLSSHTLRRINIATKCFSIRARTPKKTRPSDKWDWADVKTLTLCLDTQHQDDDVFELFEGQSFSSLYKFAYKNLKATEAIEASRLRTLFTTSTIRKLVLNLDINLGILTWEIRQIGRNLRVLELRRIRTKEVVEIGATCPNLIKMFVVEADFNDKHENIKLCSAFKDFKSLRKLVLYEKKPVAYMDLPNVESATVSAHTRVQEAASHRPKTLMELQVCNLCEKRPSRLRPYDTICVHWKMGNDGGEASVVEEHGLREFDFLGRYISWEEWNT